jgi:hypothetical protein
MESKKKKNYALDIIFDFSALFLILPALNSSAPTFLHLLAMGITTNCVPLLNLDNPMTYFFPLRTTP